MCMQYGSWGRCTNCGRRICTIPSHKRGVVHAPKCYEFPKMRQCPQRMFVIRLSLIKSLHFYSFMYIESQDIHSRVEPFFLNVCMTITLRNADIWRIAALKTSKGKTPTIYQSAWRHTKRYIVGALNELRHIVNHILFAMRQSMIITQYQNVKKEISRPLCS